MQYYDLHIEVIPNFQINIYSYITELNLLHFTRNLIN